MSARQAPRLLGGLLALAGVVAAISAGCGSGDDELPAGAAAQVRGYVISEAAVRRAVVGRIASRHSTFTMPPYLPADIEGCVAVESKRQSRAPEELRRRCVQDRERREADALSFLILGRWYWLDARERGIPIPAERPVAAGAAAHAGVDPKYLRGLTLGLILRGRVFRRVSDRVSASPIRASPVEVERFYRTHRQRYVEPGRRYVQGVTTGTQAQAQAAASELRNGRSPEQVVEAAEGGGVKLFVGGGSTPWPRGGSIKAQAAALRSTPGEVEIERRGSGWMAYRVESVVPTQRLSLGDARSLVEQDLQEAHLKGTLAQHERRLEDRYGDDTSCADRWQISECS